MGPNPCLAHFYYTLLSCCQLIRHGGFNFQWEFIFAIFDSREYRNIALNKFFRATHIALTPLNSIIDSFRTLYWQLCWIFTWFSDKNILFLDFRWVGYTNTILSIYFLGPALWGYTLGTSPSGKLWHFTYYLHLNIQCCKYNATGW